MKNKKNIMPTVLTAAAFLMTWFIIFFIVAYLYLNSFSMLVAKTGFMTDIGFVTTFYLVVGFVLVLFSVWFTNKFYSDKKAYNEKEWVKGTRS